MNEKVTAKAPPNIALVKYWGKRNVWLNLPVADSVSVCLNDFHSTAVVCPNPTGEGDKLLWNDQPIPPPYLGRWLRMLEKVREGSGLRVPVIARVRTRLPSGVGLATSASGMAALALALHRFHGFENNQREVCALARLGSGSAVRSVPGGFVVWHSGESPDGSDNFAESIAPPSHWPELRVIIPIICRMGNRVPSTEGMIRTALTSRSFHAWVRYCNEMAPRAIDAIMNKSFSYLAEIAEGHAMSMHGLCLQARPPILYLREESISLLEAVIPLKQQLPLFFTFDAGPNPILFTLEPYVQSVRQAILSSFPEVEILVSRAGPGASIATND